MHLFSFFFLVPLPFSNVSIIHLKDQIQPLHQKLLCHSGSKKWVLVFFLIHPALHWFLWASFKSHHFPFSFSFFWTSQVLFLSCPNKDPGSTLQRQVYIDGLAIFQLIFSITIIFLIEEHLVSFWGIKKNSQSTMWKWGVYKNRKHTLEN